MYTYAIGKNKITRPRDSAALLFLASLSNITSLGQMPPKL